MRATQATRTNCSIRTLANQWPARTMTARRTSVFATTHSGPGRNGPW